MITTLQKVKDRLQIGDALTDTLLTQLIETVGARFDLETGRKLERTVGYTEEFAADETVMVLGCAPVEAVTKIETWGVDSVAWTEVTPGKLLSCGSVLRLTGDRGGCKHADADHLHGGLRVPADGAGGRANGAAADFGAGGD